MPSGASLKTAPHPHALSPPNGSEPYNVPVLSMTTVSIRTPGRLERSVRAHGALLEALRERGLPLGGEQSGHVVFTRDASTGDGLLTALNIMAAMTEAGRSLADLAGVVHRLPQVLINVEVADKDAVARSVGLRAGLR